MARSRLAAWIVIVLLYAPASFAPVAAGQAEACTGENCMSGDNPVIGCKGESCLPKQENPVVDCTGENCAEAQDRPAEKCAGENCALTDGD